MRLNPASSMPTFLAIVCVALGAAVSPRQASAQTNSELLESGEWTERARGFVSLQKEPRGLARTAASGQLVRLLERENNVIVAALGDSDPASRGVSLKYGEGYSEYYALVLGACNSLCNKEEPRTIEALANGAYNANSRFARELARTHGPQALGVVMKRARSPHTTRRQGALGMLGTISQHSASLTSEHRADIHALIVSATSDTDIGVRYMAVETLGVVGGAQDIALLSRVASEDADPVVRKAAAAALSRIPRQP